MHSLFDTFKNYCSFILRHLFFKRNFTKNFARIEISYLLFMDDHIASLHYLRTRIQRRISCWFRLEHISLCICIFDYLTRNHISSVARVCGKANDIHPTDYIFYDEILKNINSFSLSANMVVPKFTIIKVIYVLWVL